jgi:hypothetical protein
LWQIVPVKQQIVPVKQHFVANCACKAAFWVNLWQIVPVKQHILCKGTNEPDGEKQAMAHKMGFKTSSP